MITRREVECYKVIVMGIREMITDTRGRKTKMDSFDRCIDEIFGVNHISRKISDVYTNRDIIDIINRVGMEYMFQLMNNPKLRSILKEMVEIDVRIVELRKEIKKQRRKNGKGEKYDIKEYNWLNKTFKKSASYLRDRFGIKNRRTAYKKRYRSINDNVLNRDDYDDEFSSVMFRNDDSDYDFDINPIYERDMYRDRYNDRKYDDRYYDDDDYDDDFDEDDYENYRDGTSELQDFEYMMNGTIPRTVKPIRKKGRRTKPSRRSRLNYDLDVDYDDDDDEPEEPMYVGDLDGQLTDLREQVSYLSDSIQFLINKDMYNSGRIQDLRNATVKLMNGKLVPPEVDPDYDEAGYNFDEDRFKFPKGPSKTPEKTEISIITEFVDKLGKDVIDLKKHNNVLVDVINEMRKTQGVILDVIADDFDDEDDDFDDDEIEEPMNDTLFTKPVIQEDGPTNIIDAINSSAIEIKQISSDSADNEEPLMSREELIDEINRVNVPEVKTETVDGE